MREVNAALLVVLVIWWAIFGTLIRHLAMQLVAAALLVWLFVFDGWEPLVAAWWLHQLCWWAALAAFAVQLDVVQRLRRLTRPPTAVLSGPGIYWLFVRLPSEGNRSRYRLAYIGEAQDMAIRLWYHRNEARRAGKAWKTHAVMVPVLYHESRAVRERIESRQIWCIDMWLLICGHLGFTNHRLRQQRSTVAYSRRPRGGRAWALSLWMIGYLVQTVLHPRRPAWHRPMALSREAMITPRAAQR